MATLVPGQVLASGSYEAMVLACIDPRFQGPVRKYLKEQELSGKYSQFTIAGASIGVVAHAFRHWQETYWDNLDITIDLHRIKRVIVINHRGCGAARVAYGDEAVKPDREEATHKKALDAFRKRLSHRRRYEGIDVTTLLMALDGSVKEL